VAICRSPSRSSTSSCDSCCYIEDYPQDKDDEAFLDCCAAFERELKQLQDCQHAHCQSLPDTCVEPVCTDSECAAAPTSEMTACCHPISVSWENQLAGSTSGHFRAPASVQVPQHISSHLPSSRCSSHSSPTSKQSHNFHHHARPKQAKSCRTICCDELNCDFRATPTNCCDPSCLEKPKMNSMAQVYGGLSELSEEFRNANSESSDEASIAALSGTPLLANSFNPRNVQQSLSPGSGFGSQAFVEHSGIDQWFSNEQTRAELELLQPHSQIDTAMQQLLQMNSNPLQRAQPMMAQIHTGVPSIRHQPKHSLGAFLDLRRQQHMEVSPISQTTHNPTLQTQQMYTSAATQLPTPTITSNGFLDHNGDFRQSPSTFMPQQRHQHSSVCQHPEHRANTPSEADGNYFPCPDQNHPWTCSVDKCAENFPTGEAFYEHFQATHDRKDDMDMAKNVPTISTLPMQAPMLVTPPSTASSATFNSSAASTTSFNGGARQCRWLIDGTMTECGQCFNSATDLQEHIKGAHTAETKKATGFLCRWAGCSRPALETFTQKSKLERHMQTHTGFKSDQCPQCGKWFSAGQALTQHLRTHTGLRPFKCSICTKDFAQASALSKCSRPSFLLDFYNMIEPK
jgi:hypothetical protein